MGLSHGMDITGLRPTSNEKGQKRDREKGQKISPFSVSIL